MLGVAVPVVSAIATGWAILLTAAAAATAATAAAVKLRPERDSLIAQAADHATSAMREAFDRLERELRISRAEVQRLLAREQELIRRIDILEAESRRELDRLRHREQQLLERVDALEADLARHSAAD